MLSNRQIFRTPQHYSARKNNRLHSPGPSKKTDARYRVLAQIIRRIIKNKMSSHFNQWSILTNQKIKKSIKLQKFFLIVKKNKLRTAFHAVRRIQKNIMRKNASLQMLSIIFRETINKRKKEFFYGIKKTFLNREKDKAFNFIFSFIQNWSRRKNLAVKLSTFNIMKNNVEDKYKKAMSFKKILSSIMGRLKVYGFLKIVLSNQFKKTSQMDEQPPTVQSQENIDIFPEERRQMKKIKKSTSETNLNQIACKLKDSIQEKQRRSLSRKSRVSSLIDDDLASILIGSFCSKKLGDSQKTSEENKIQYYKNIAKSYRKQLNIMKSELEVMKEMNQNYENEIDGFVTQYSNKEVMLLKHKISLLRTEKQKYKQRSKNYENQILQIKNQFKKRMQILQKRLKKQQF